MRDACAAAVDAALGAGASYADARAVVRRVAVRRHEERPGRHALRRRDRRDRRPRARRRRLGVRLRPAALARGRARRRAPRPRIRRGGRRNDAPRARPGRRALGDVPHADGARPVRRPARREGRALPARRGGASRTPTSRSRRPRSGRRARRSSSSPPTGSRSSRSSSSAAAASQAVAIGEGLVQVRAYPSAHVGSSAQAGWEYVESLGLEREAPRVAEQAAALLRADECPAKVTTAVIDAEQMQMQVHESVGHPTELDRVYGTEAAYAGTSFLNAGDTGNLRYGSEHMNITADSTTPARPRQLRVRRRGRARRARADRPGGHPPRLPHLARDGRPARAGRTAARCAPTAGRGCRSSG